MDFEDYHKTGYGVFSLNDLISTEDIKEIDRLGDMAMTVPINDDTYQYILSVFGFHNDPEWPFTIPVSEKAWRFEKLKENNLRATQRWYQSAQDPLQLKGPLRRIVNKFLLKIYPELSLHNIQHMDAITIYKQEDHTEVHRDGQNPGRVCVVLMYLTPESLCKEGGQLVINGDEPAKDTDSIVVNPFRGTVAMLDFNNHNPYHGVTPVIDDFNRYCYISFVHNIDKLPPNLKPKGYP